MARKEKKPCAMRLTVTECDGFKDFNKRAEKGCDNCPKLRRGRRG